MNLGRARLAGLGLLAGLFLGACSSTSGAAETTLSPSATPWRTLPPVSATEIPTSATLPSINYTVQRGDFSNSIAKKAIEMEHEGKTIQEIGPIVSGAKGRVVYETGDLEHGVWSAGTCMGLINDIPSCNELVERIVSEAEAMIKGRLAKAIAA